MFLRLVQDLRFVIGLFFALVGLLLMGVGIADPASSPDGLRLNLWAGSLMTGFAALMIVLSLRWPMEE